MNFKDYSKSTFIFDLIDKYQVVSSSALSQTFTDVMFEAFSKEYIEMAERRDDSLNLYLVSNPKLFRCYLPPSKWTFGVAREVVWYYDELIIDDPICKIINDEGKTVNYKKETIARILSNMGLFKECIEGGYLYFTSAHLIREKEGKYITKANDLLAYSDVQTAFENWSPMGQKRSPINDNPEDDLIQLQARYAGHFLEIEPMGMYIPEHIMKSSEKLKNGITFNFVSPYTRLTKEEIIKYGKQDILDSLRGVYAEDAAIIIHTVDNSKIFNCPILFFRDVDSIVATKYIETNLTDSINPTIEKVIYDCIVPYIQGIPPERLFEIRNKIPNAFFDFRFYLYEIVKETQKEVDNPEEFRFRIENKIRAKLNSLEGEMKTAWTNFVFKSASSLAMLIGTLSVNSFFTGVLGSGGIINEIGAIRGLVNSRKEQSKNPAYFLWRAQQ
ncbi:MAG TPA: hypothetical protein VN922_21890 [Bacteroidia bacterium]|nr:hypothetical protein [Bacteroidia bacterium]